MKTRIIKSILVMLLAFFAVPLFAQDALVVFFNDGNFRKFYLRDIVSISTSQYDEDGVAHNDYQYQHITTKKDKFVYDLSNINCIGFSKYDEVKAEQNFVEAMPEVFNALSDCETISDAEAQIEQIKNQEGVEDAWSDGHTLFVKIDKGEMFSFHFNHQLEGNETESEDYQDLAKEMVSKVKNAGAKEKSNLKVAIVDQEYNNKKESMVADRTNHHDPLINALKECGIIPAHVTNPNVDFFYDNSNDSKNLHFYDYDVVLLFTHGLYFKPVVLDSDQFKEYNKIVHGILTSDEILSFNSKEQPSWNDNYSKFKDWKNNSKYKDIPDYCINFTFQDEIREGKKYWILYPILTELFFKDYSTGHFPDNSVLYISACKSLKGDTPEQSTSFADILFGKNLAIYLGYTETDCLGYWVLPQLFKYTIDTGYSLEKAYNLLPEYRRHETLVNFQNSGYYSEQDITYLRDNGILHDAELKILPEESDEAKRYFFFRVYTNESDQDKVNQEYSQNQTVTLEGITTHLNATVKDLHYGFKYKEVDIGHNPLDSWNPVELWEEEESVEASLVPMTIDSDKGNRLFKATLSDLESGKTYVYRAYTYDGLHFNYGEPCAFTIKEGGDIPSYTSCPDNNHPHLIDLGLPSGTKWACCNVGADKPEDYGGYYAWGETEEKSSYTDKNYLDGKGTSYNIGNDIAGTQYDAAMANWGSPWVMPSLDQVNELLDNCTSEWTTENGVNGRRFTGSNGASIFLPAAGSRWGVELRYAGSRGYFWSSSLYESYPDYAYFLIYFSSGRANWYYDRRYGGQSVRPVRKN